MIIDTDEHDAVLTVNKSCFNPRESNYILNFKYQVHFMTSSNEWSELFIWSWLSSCTIGCHGNCLLSKLYGTTNMNCVNGVVTFMGGPIIDKTINKF